MNKKRRKALAELHEALTGIADRLETLRDEEQDGLDNLPETIQGSERGNVMTEAVDAMQEAYDALETAIESIATARGE